METASMTVMSIFMVPLIVLVVFGSLLAAFAIICWTIVRLVSKGNSSGSGSVDESKLIQEIYHGLTKMEQRVEALETLLLDRERKGGQA